MLQSPPFSQGHSRPISYKMATLPRALVKKFQKNFLGISSESKLMRQVFAGFLRTYCAQIGPPELCLPPHRQIPGLLGKTSQNRPVAMTPGSRSYRDTSSPSISVTAPTTSRPTQYSPSGVHSNCREQKNRGELRNWPPPGARHAVFPTPRNRAPTAKGPTRLTLRTNM